MHTDDNHESTNGSVWVVVVHNNGGVYLVWLKYDRISTFCLTQNPCHYMLSRFLFFTFTSVRHGSWGGLAELESRRRFFIFHLSGTKNMRLVVSHGTSLWAWFEMCLSAYQWGWERRNGKIWQKHSKKSALFVLDFSFLAPVIIGSRMEQSQWMMSWMGSWVEQLCMHLGDFQVCVSREDRHKLFEMLSPHNDGLFQFEFQSFLWTPGSGQYSSHFRSSLLLPFILANRLGFACLDLISIPSKYERYQNKEWGLFRPIQSNFLLLTTL